MLEVKENVWLKDYTTFEIGGPSRYLTEVESLDDVKQAVEFAKEKKLPLLVLGGGSNVLVADDGWNGLVLINKIRGLELREDGVVTVSSGEDWDKVVESSVVLNLQGIECLSGIPGSAGGALVQNIGAYGQTLADVIDSVTVFNVENSAIEIWNKEKCRFAYRNSWFKTHDEDHMVMSFVMTLKPNAKPVTAYPDVAEYFTANQAVTLMDVRKAVIEIRGSKGYVIMPGYERYQSAGSFFKNPVITTELFDELKKKIEPTTKPWHWNDKDGVKVSAARLLESAGFIKGFRQGNAGISPKHPLALINAGGAKASEVIKLAKMIKSEVMDKFGVKLEYEVKIIGNSR
jgi:UDP-N-acetylmuramate dehydrogenase